MQQQRFIVRGRFGKELQQTKHGFILIGLFSLMPVVLLYGLRINIGTDYRAYEIIYILIKTTPYDQYLKYHFTGIDDYYCEIGFALLNKIMPSYRALLFAEGIVFDFYQEVNAGFALYIFLCTQFIYFMNGVRFLIAACIVLLAIKNLNDDKNRKFFICILIAALFHKTALFCIIFYFIREFRREDVNKLRNILLIFGIALFPILLPYIMRVASYIPAFARYFSRERYAAEFGNFGFGWLMHIVPVLYSLTGIRT